MSYDAVILARREEWIDALLSGHYEQDTGVLRTSTGHCCLGVACDVIDPSRWTGTSHPYWGSHQPYWGSHQPTSVPSDVRIYFALHMADASDLASMNDHGADFGDIAAYIYELPIAPSRAVELRS